MLVAGQARGLAPGEPVAPRLGAEREPQARELDELEKKLEERANLKREMEEMDGELVEKRRKLAHMADDKKLLVHKIFAEHSTPSAKKQPSSAFNGLRPFIHAVRGCKMMLTRNVAYLYGLANGTRGSLVGVVYGPGGIGTLPEAVVLEALSS